VRVARAPKLVLPPWNRAHYLGVDENGMGPRLGPLIVTSVLARTDEAGGKLVSSKPRGAVGKRIGDSKKLVAFDDSALGEAWARAIASRIRGDAPEPTTPAELLAAIGLDTERHLQAPCPSHHVDLCWNREGEAFVSTDEAVAACSKDLDRLAAIGAEVIRVRVAVVCTRRLNDAVTQGLSRFDVDLHTMERLALDAREAAGDEIYAFCGKVGGFDFYGRRFGPLAGHLHTVLAEGRAWSEYHLPGIGRLAFVRDADDSHLIVGLASLVGKWARDHLMRRVIRYHRVHDAALPDASGYHDPVTTQFIRASELIRRKQRVEVACFERTALGTTSSRSTREGPTSPSAARTTPRTELLTPPALPNPPALPKPRSTARSRRPPAEA